MEQDDRFDWLIDECQVSHSEAFDLQHCSYFGESDSDDSNSGDGDRNPAGVPVESTGISTLSPPDLPEDELPNHRSNVPEDQEIYHTPPEFRWTPTSSDYYSDDRMVGNGLDRDGGTVPIEAESGSVVDLWRDTDLGFTELESEENRVSRRESSPTEALELSDTEALLGSLRNATPSPGGTPELTLEIDNGEGNSEGNKKIVGDIDQVPCISENGSNSRAMEVKTKGKRPLPSWANPRVEDDHQSADEELVVNGRVGDDERVGEEAEVNERAIGNARGDERVDEDGGPEVLPSLVNGSNSRAMEVKTKGKRPLPSWENPRVENDHQSADEELVVNGRVGDDERVCEEAEVDERAIGNARGGERVDEDVGPEVLPSLVNGREPVHSNTGTNCVRENIRRRTVLDVLLHLEKDTEEDTSLYSLSLLEVAQQKWGKFV